MRYLCSGTAVSCRWIGGIRSSGTAVLPHKNIQNGTTSENVLREMQLAIDHAYDHHDKEAQKLWDMIASKGERPTPEEFIFAVSMMIQNGDGLLQ